MKKLTSNQVVMLGLLTAIEIVLSRFLSISTPIVKIGFAFLPIAIAAIWYGPFWAAASAGAADFIGAILFPIGEYFPGFTLTAALTGATYGLFLYKNPDKVWRVVAAVLTINICMNMFLDTVWLSMIMGKAVTALIAPRALKCLVLIPIQIVLVRLAQKKLLPLAPREYRI